MSPEKERWVLAAVCAYEVAVLRTVELAEKRDKLRAAQHEAQKQLEEAAEAADYARRELFQAAALDLPPPTFGVPV